MYVKYIILRDNLFFSRTILNLERSKKKPKVPCSALINARYTLKIVHMQYFIKVFNYTLKKV